MNNDWMSVVAVIFVIAVLYWGYVFLEHGLLVIAVQLLLVVLGLYFADLIWKIVLAAIIGARLLWDLWGNSAAAAKKTLFAEAGGKSVKTWSDYRRVRFVEMGNILSHWYLGFGFLAFLHHEILNAFGFMPHIRPVSATLLSNGGIYILLIYNLVVWTVRLLKCSVIDRSFSIVLLRRFGPGQKARTRWKVAPILGAYGCVVTINDPEFLGYTVKDTMGYREALTGFALDLAEKDNWQAIVRGAIWNADLIVFDLADVAPGRGLLWELELALACTPGDRLMLLLTRAQFESWKVSGQPCPPPLAQYLQEHDAILLQDMTLTESLQLRTEIRRRLKRLVGGSPHRATRGS